MKEALQPTGTYLELLLEIQSPRFFKMESDRYRVYLNYLTVRVDLVSSSMKPYTPVTSLGRCGFRQPPIPASYLHRDAVKLIRNCN